MIVTAKQWPREAWRYTGQPEGEWPAWVRSCVEYDSLGWPHLLRRSGRQLLHWGEWLLRDLDGDPEWLTHDQMIREYDEVRP